MRNPIPHKGLMLLLVALTTVLLGCPQQVTVQDLLKNPDRYRGKEVAIVATAVPSAGLARPGAFRADDGTGEMWVLCGKYAAPSRDMRVVVIGRVTKLLNVTDGTVGVALRQTEKVRPVPAM